MAFELQSMKPRLPAAARRRHRSWALDHSTLSPLPIPRQDFIRTDLEASRIQIGGQRRNPATVTFVSFARRPGGVARRKPAGRVRPPGALYGVKGLTRDIRGQASSEKRQEVLSAELGPSRSQNVLARVTAVVGSTRRAAGSLRVVPTLDAHSINAQRHVLLSQKPLAAWALPNHHTPPALPPPIHDRQIPDSGQDVMLAAEETQSRRHGIQRTGDECREARRLSSPDGRGRGGLGEPLPARRNSDYDDRMARGWRPP